jgi:hypothetical protein
VGHIMRAAVATIAYSAAWRAAIDRMADAT